MLQNVLLAKAFTPKMIKQGWGRIIAISSICAMQCAPGQSAYDSGKRGMDGVLRVLAKEVGAHGITVVSPATDTSHSRRTVVMRAKRPLGKECT